MPSYMAEVFLDDRPVLKKTFTASGPHTVSARAIKEAVMLKRVRHRVEKYVVRLVKLLPKLKNPK